VCFFFLKRLKNGKPLTNDNRVKTEVRQKTIHNLNIQNVNADDVAEYTFIAENEAGKVSETFRLTLSSKKHFKLNLVLSINYSYQVLNLFLKAPPAIVKAFNPVEEATAETPVCLELLCTGNPLPTIAWTKDRKPLEKLDNINLTSEVLNDSKQIVHRLTISSVTSGDAGVYSAKIKNTLGEATANGKLEVLYKPVFVKELAAETFIKEKDLVKLTTDIQANPKAEVTWYKKTNDTTESSETKITNDAKLKADEQKTVNNLTIKDALLTDAVTYICVAKNKVGESRTQTKLNICVPPKFLRVPEANNEIEINKDLTAVCVVRGLPVPLIKFIDLKTKEELAADEETGVEVKSIPVGDTEVEFTLNLRGVNTEKTPASLECIAFNSVGEAKAKMEIKVIRKPEFVVRPAEVISLQIGKDVLLECSVVASPNATFSWFKDGKKLSASKRVITGEDKQTKTNFCRIVSAVKEDSGSYEVVATNKLGECRASSDLTIEYAPIITKDLKAKEKALEDQTFKYEVSAKGCPKPTVAWFNEDTELTAANNEEFVTTSENEVYSLTIKRIRSSSAGRYRAVASNELGKAQSVISELDVDLKPTIKALFESQEALKHEVIKAEADAELVLEFKVDGKPVPVVSLYRDDTLIKSSEKRVTLTKKDENVYVFSICDLKSADGGVYKIQAKNSLSTASFLVDLKIRAAPKLVKVLKDKIELIEGIKSELICSVGSGVYPVPDCKWFINDEVISLNDLSKFVQLQDDKAGNSLVIERPELWMDGAKFRFECSNELGSVETTTSVEVITAPVFTVNISSAEPYLSQPFEWNFSLDANPEVKLKVFRNDKELNLQRESRIVLTSVSEMKEGRRVTDYKLAFDKTTGEDLGLYRIEAANKAGSAVTQADLIVKGGPCFIRKPSDGSFLIGKPVKVEFEISGIPDPDIVWLKDGEAFVVPSGDRVKIENRGKTIYLLNIKTCAKEDFGVYTVKLSNENGQAEETFTLSLQSKNIYLIFDKQKNQLNIIHFYLGIKLKLNLQQ